MVQTWLYQSGMHSKNLSALIETVQAVWKRAKAGGAEAGALKRAAPKRAAPKRADTWKSGLW